MKRNFDYMGQDFGVGSGQLTESCMARMACQRAAARMQASEQGYDRQPTCCGAPGGPLTARPAKPSCSATDAGVYSLLPRNTYDFAHSVKPSSCTWTCVPYVIRPTCDGYAC